MGRKKKLITETEISNPLVPVMESNGASEIKVKKSGGDVAEVIIYPNSTSAEKMHKGNIEDFMNLPKTIEKETYPKEALNTRRILVGNPPDLNQLGGKHFQVL